MEIEPIYYFIAAALIAAAWCYTTTHKNDDGKIKDVSVKVPSVLEVLNSFKAKKSPELKTGYTEKSIGKQLLIHLRQSFEHVTSQYGIEGINGLSIDFNIGNGKVGLEIKLAKSVFKTAEFHRLIGQIDDYVMNKYDSENLIVAVFGEKEHFQDKVMIKKIEDKILEKKGVFIFIEIQ